jgi:hypothetical protein
MRRRKLWWLAPYLETLPINAWSLVDHRGLVSFGDKVWEVRVVDVGQVIKADGEDAGRQLQLELLQRRY